TLEQLGLDSLERIELALKAEDAFGASLQQDHIDPKLSLRALYELLRPQSAVSERYELLPSQLRFSVPTVVMGFTRLVGIFELDSQSPERIKEVIVDLPRRHPALQMLLRFSDGVPLQQLHPSEIAREIAVSTPDDPCSDLHVEMLRSLSADRSAEGLTFC